MTCTKCFGKGYTETVEPGIFMPTANVRLACDCVKNAIQTETPEEKEAFDRIDTTNAQFESLAVEVNRKTVRTNTTYEPMRGLAVSEAFRAMEDDGDVFVNCCDGSFEGMDGCIINLANAIHDGFVIYRKVEKEIDWRDEVKSYIESVEYLSKNDKIESVYNGDESEDDEVWESEFIGMCHLVASLTDKPE